MSFPLSPPIPPTNPPLGRRPFSCMHIRDSKIVSQYTVTCGICGTQAQRCRMEATPMPCCTTSHRHHHDPRARQLPKYDTLFCRLHRVGARSSPVPMHREVLPPAAHSSLQINFAADNRWSRWDTSPEAKGPASTGTIVTTACHASLLLVLRCWPVGVVSLSLILRAQQTCQGETVLMSTTIDRKWMLHFPVPCRRQSHRWEVGHARNRPVPPCLALKMANFQLFVPRT